MIDELRALADTLGKATPGPWEVRRTSEKWGAVDVTGRSACSYLRCVYVCEDVPKPDADAICAARNSEDLLRQAADELERLQKVVDQMKRLLTTTPTQIVETDGSGITIYYCTGDPECRNDWHFVADVFDAPDLVAELEARNG